MNTTFFNPSVGISCENCDFIAKNKSGLQVHMRAKHRENREMLKQAIVSCESIPELIFKCDLCEYICENEDVLNMHMNEKHENENELSEIKLEVFAIVDFGVDALETRKIIIEKLNEQKDVEKVLQVFVNKSENFIDINNLIWNAADIFLTTKCKPSMWKNQKFIKSIFSKAFLWETYQLKEGNISREDVERRKHQNHLEELRARGYMGY